jgi:hypothetical protein
MFEVTPTARTALKGILEQHDGPHAVRILLQPG